MTPVDWIVISLLLMFMLLYLFHKEQTKKERGEREEKEKQLLEEKLEWEKRFKEMEKIKKEIQIWTEVFFRYWMFGQEISVWKVEKILEDTVVISSDGEYYEKHILDLFIK